MDSIESEIQAKGLTAPRVTLDDLNAAIVHTEIVKHVSAGGQIMRWAVITTRNGYAVTGRPSVAVSPANDNAELGEKLAVDNARNAGLLAVRMLGIADDRLRERMGEFQVALEATAREKGDRLRESVDR